MPLAAEDFDRFFELIHGVRPFPWQSRLARMVCAGRWPSPIGLPTAAGKTAAIDVALFALAMGAPGAARRIFFVIDRRIVVDEAADRAVRLAQRLRWALRSRRADPLLREVAENLVRLTGEQDADPLVVATLRGGWLRDESWLRSPLQPLVCCSTVDQVGSSLLFRGYGARSPANWPIRAALTSHDALFLVDEAHTSLPWLETLSAIAGRYRCWAEDLLPGGLTVVELSATPTREPELRDEEPDRQDPVLGPRLSASKPAVLVDLKTASDEVSAREALIQQLVTQALSYATQGCRRVGVVVNRVAAARAVHWRLKSKAADRCLLLTGRCRPFERDRLLRLWRNLLEGPLPEQPVFVVATQCIEVGANLDFDALVSESASLDSLQQRFGRLNRKGHWRSSPACVILPARVEGEQDDPVYGAAFQATWRWLEQHAVAAPKTKQSWLDFGVLALRGRLPSGDELAKLCAPRQHAPALLPAHLDLLAQTSPEPAPRFDVSTLLHGRRVDADVALLWRGDLDAGRPEYWAQLVAACPPSAAEAVSLPVYVVARWLRGLSATDLADQEGVQPTPEAPAGPPGRQVLCWRGPADSKVIRADELAPGMTLVAPASYGGCDEFGWNPESGSPVVDIAELVSLHYRGRAVLRLAEPLLRQWPQSPGGVLSDPLRAGLETLRSLETSAVRDFLKLVAGDESLRPEVRLIARLLSRESKLRLILDPATADSPEPRLGAIVGARRWRIAAEKTPEADFLQEDESSSMTAEVGLETHLNGVADRAKRYGQALGLPARLVRTLEWAGRLHDLGKADPRFQSWLRGGRPWVPEVEEPLAKSGVNPRDWAAMQRARRLAGYPNDGRHELVSAALAQQVLSSIEGELDPELLLHLIESHHGRCRPFAPVVDDGASVEVRYEIHGVRLSISSRHGLERLDSGVADRWWLLTRRYGWYGLALLESLLRLADHRQSEHEQQQAARG